MGVVNVTPDSFSDGGRFLDPVAAIDHAQRLIAEGADLLDIGAESSRPGAAAVVSADEELRRLLPVLRGLRSARAASATNICRAFWKSLRQSSATPWHASPYASSAFSVSSVTTTFFGGGAPRSECQRAEHSRPSCVQ